MLQLENKQGLRQRLLDNPNISSRMKQALTNLSDSQVDKMHTSFRQHTGEFMGIFIDNMIPIDLQSQYALAVLNEEMVKNDPHCIPEVEMLHTNMFNQEKLY